ncbi:helix-turn-helix domain-containing protein [Domibacillus enclensis]|uniref:Helix-turn-helix n=1 Tax=Domibacillus enclensis TaxID=1017273 RepID=A0A1N6NUK8_9BACI|nr:helix-turn-helix transcriptional regulator [Domibacillus enclensis]OXS80149.1 transcriptional regulator [Domibacillus enclensis]SIP95818.1 Helix-turn-helix [Domibacillus enclensis]
MYNIGEVIKKYRKEAKLTATELAERIGVTQGTISQLETGKRKPSIDMLERIASVLGIPEKLLKAFVALDKSDIKELTVNINLGVTELSCNFSTKISDSVNLESLTKEEQFKIQNEYNFLSPIFMKTVSRYIIDNKLEIEKQFKENVINTLKIKDVEIDEKH